MEIFKDLKDIEIDGELIGEVMFKPTTPIYIMYAAAIGLMFVDSLAARILGAFIVLVDTFVIFKVKDKKVLGVYTKCILVYDADGVKAYKINNEDIANYDTGTTEQYKVYIKLYDERKITRETYRMREANKYLAKALPKKTTLEIKQKENKDLKFDPVKGIKRIFGFTKKTENKKMDIKRKFIDALDTRLEEVYQAQGEKLAQVAKMFGECMDNQGIVQLFGVKHAVEFVNELNYRAGGIAYYHKLSLSDLMLHKQLSKKADFETGEAYNDLSIIDKMYALYQMDDRDMFVFVSERGDEPVVIEWAKRVKAKGQKVVAVVNKKTYDKVGGTLLDYADLWLDMMADEVDSALEVNGVKVGQLGSTTTDIMAQMITAELYSYFIEKHGKAPVLLSANVKGADVHNNALTDPYERRIR